VQNKHLNQASDARLRGHFRAAKSHSQTVLPPSTPVAIVRLLLGAPVKAHKTEQLALRPEIPRSARSQ
jgi:hypothetical protein